MTTYEVALKKASAIRPCIW